MVEEKTLNNFITEYKAKKGLELEIRLKNVLREDFEIFYNNLMAEYAQYKRGKGSQIKDVKIEQSLNIISKNIYGGEKKDTSYIRQIIFEPGLQGNAEPKKVGDKYIKKVTILFPQNSSKNEFIRYSINLNSEEEIGRFSSKQNALARFKNRISFYSDDWRYDLTIVKAVKLADCGSMLKKIVGEVFTPLTPETFLSAIKKIHTNSLEVEAEYIGSSEALNRHKITFMLKYMCTLIDKDYAQKIDSQKIIYEVAKLIVPSEKSWPEYLRQRGLKQLLNQAISLDHYVHNKIYPMSGYLVTEKADGIRCLIYFDGATLHLISKGYEQYNVAEEQLAKKGAANDQESRIVCEGEYMKDRLLIFDVMYYQGEKVYNLGANMRIKFLGKVIKALSAYKFGPDQEGEGKICPSFEAKTFVELPNWAKKYGDISAHCEDIIEEMSEIMREKWEAKYAYNIDGLILTSPQYDYRHTKSYKWKPPEHNTIDFMAIKAPKNILGIKPLINKPGKDLYLLFSAINFDQKDRLGLKLAPFYDILFPENKNIGSGAYLPIQFSPSANPLEYLYYHDKNGPDINYKIVEMKKDISKAKKGANEDFGRQFRLGEWIIDRIREDRSYERITDFNNFKVAEKIYMNYLNPIFFENLYEPPKSYFMFLAPTTYKAKNYYNRMIINNLIYNNANEAPWLVDLGGGRGGDIARYNEAGVRDALFIDKDIYALTELIQRKYVIADNDQKEKVRVDKLRRKSVTGGGVDIKILHADLTEKYDKILGQINELGYEHHPQNACVCNFALHYMCGSEADIDNIVALVDALLDKSGIFMFTVMNGQKVFDLIGDMDYGQKWSLSEDGAEKYAIKKLFKGNSFAEYGQMISVKMPFANEYYEEPICNIDYIIRKFRAKKFVAELNESFSARMEAFKAENNHAYKNLTEADKEYIDIHSYVTLRKMA